MNRKEALIQMAQQRGVDIAIAKAALEDADREAIRSLLHQLEFAADSKFVIPKFIDEALRAAKANNKVLEIADILLEKRSNVLYPLAHELGMYTDEKAVSLLRQITTLSWASEQSRTAGASALIYAAHLADCEDALHDPLELVRTVAVKQLERKQNTPALIRALKNENEVVRSIAAWYMGRNKVYESVDSLCEMASLEKNIEALRAAIWSIGVLRIKTARQHLEPFVQHENTIIRATAKEALDKLV